MNINKLKMANNFELINELVRIRNKWEGTGLLHGLKYQDQLKLSQLLNSGAKFLTECANGVYDEITEFNKFQSTEDLTGLLLPAISRKYRKELKEFDLEDLVELLNNNADLYYQLQEKARKPDSSSNRKYIFDYDDEFLNIILND